MPVPPIRTTFSSENRGILPTDARATNRFGAEAQLCAPRLCVISRLCRSRIAQEGRASREARVTNQVFMFFSVGSVFWHLMGFSALQQVDVPNY
jgi:hypothetical protein